MYNVLIFGGLTLSDLSLTEEIIHKLDVKPALVTFLNCLEPTENKQGSIMNLEDIIFKERVEKMALFQDTIKTTHLQLNGKVRYGYCKPNLIEFIRREKPHIVFFLGDFDSIKRNFFDYEKEDYSLYYSQDVSILIDANAMQLSEAKIEKIYHTTSKLKKQEIINFLSVLEETNTKPVSKSEKNAKKSSFS
jgi:hypothetical protein